MLYEYRYFLESTQTKTLASLCLFV